MKRILAVKAETSEEIFSIKDFEKLLFTSWGEGAPDVNKPAYPQKPL